MAATAQTSRSVARRRPSAIVRRERNWGLLFLAPWIVGFLLFIAGPMIASLIFSFTDLVLVRPEETKFVGLANWARMLSDPMVLKSLGVTGRYLLISVPIALALPLLMAVLLNSRYLFGRPIFRALFYLPVMIPAVAGTLIWNGVLNTQSGWINLFIERIGLAPPDWLNDPRWVVPALTLIGTWGVGNTMVIMLAGLQTVPTELYDAAKVDGAGPVYSFFNITIPMISPVIFYNLVLAVIGAFQYFLTAYVLYNGLAGPGDSALFYMYNLYREAFVYYNMGYASALAWGLFLVAVAVTVGLFASARRWVYYAGGEQ
jgi:multiple sugar transport system permease protein